MLGRVELSTTEESRGGSGGVGGVEVMLLVENLFFSGGQGARRFQHERYVEHPPQEPAGHAESWVCRRTTSWTQVFEFYLLCFLLVVAILCVVRPRSLALVFCRWGDFILLRSRSRPTTKEKAVGAVFVRRVRR